MIFCLHACQNVSYSFRQLLPLSAKLGRIVELDPQVVVYVFYRGSIRNRHM